MEDKQNQTREAGRPGKLVPTPAVNVLSWGRGPKVLLNCAVSLSPALNPQPPDSAVPLCMTLPSRAVAAGWGGQPSPRAAPLPLSPAGPHPQAEGGQRGCAVHRQCLLPLGWGFSSYSVFGGNRCLNKVSKCFPNHANTRQPPVLTRRALVLQTVKHQ